MAFPTNLCPPKYRILHRLLGSSVKRLSCSGFIADSLIDSLKTCSEAKAAETKAAEADDNTH
jgi:hypothetical protein